MMKTNFEIGPIFSSLLKNKTGPLLVALQVALSLAILVNAIYIVNLRLEVSARPSGLSDEKHSFRLNISNQKRGGHEDQVAMQKQEAAILRAVPGVVSVARVNSFPVSRSGNMAGVAASRSQATVTTSAGQYYTPDSLVKTWGLKLIEGRDFLPNEIVEIDPNSNGGSTDVVIISLALAKKLFPNASSYVGKEFYQGTGDDANALRIIGVVETLQDSSATLNNQGEFATIQGVRLSNDPWSGYAVKTEPGQRDRVMKDAESALRKNSAQPLNIRMRTMEEFRTERYRGEKGLAYMLLAVCVLLLIITASGIVGMSALWVNQRRKYIGVRRALGARRIDIVRYFITENAMIVSFGIALGLLAALGLNLVLVKSFELPRLPLHYFYIAPFGFWILGVLAVYWPANKAASISPATATRSV
jgi:putative ABC transport system permease protein